MYKHYISMLVSNCSGVLTRISGLFARRGYNIESLSVCATEDNRYSRMTVAVYGDDRRIEQLKRQLSKQIDVLCIDEMNEDAVMRELLLVKIGVGSEKRAEILDVCKIFKAKILDLCNNTMVLELTGNSKKIDAFIDMLLPFAILELARSGVSALKRGEELIKDKIVTEI